MVLCSGGRGIKRSGHVPFPLRNGLAASFREVVCGQREALLPVRPLSWPCLGVPGDFWEGP